MPAVFAKLIEGVGSRPSDRLTLLPDNIVEITSPKSTARTTSAM